MLALKQSIFHATPRQLMFSLIVDALFLILLRPSTPLSITVYIIFLPGFDLVSAVVSYWNYVQAYKQASHG
ncbi:hypothetical protein ACRHK7_03225 [Weissella tructae]|jgi:hypothetical protein|uniref:Uncharacterized protein n=2 Tax=Weissella TaxID=46255 RepID=A0A075TX64_9LACO|nr:MULTISPECIES: hypothetical protein [Weissella]AIG66174.1 hypothetical protein WS08_1236 [Weissella tructae]AIM63556.1 hypothetical protein WS74_1307 [Weissella ceti]AIM64891.1 hypothetical protein WS105_1301 [Weissella ceti]ELA07546.1 hypothetical protein WCNC_03782 [Weissella ceti NC36]QVV91323.1 hypothetical protein KHQ32_06840 [Weissella tructae]